jgi:D-alanyl-D-alanine carboxypeptidase
MKLHNMTILAAFVTCMLAACSKGDGKHNLVEKQIYTSVDSVRVALERSNNIEVPSLNVYIQTPDDIYFVSTTSQGTEPVRRNTNYRFASVTKNFTATAILYMHQLKWLNIKDQVTAAIPGSNQPYVPTGTAWNFPYKQEVTIEQLLKHSAGVYDLDNDTVPGYNGLPYTEYMVQQDPNHQFTSSELVGVLTEKNISYWAPDQGYHYSNTGYTILGEIIARVYSQRAGTVKTYGDFLRDKVYGKESKVPLSLSFVHDALDQQLPQPYVKGRIITETGIEITDKVNMSQHVAEGNGIGTMEHLNKYIRTLMKGENILSKETVQMMQHTPGPEAGNPYSLGCTLFPNLGYGHNGATNGYLNLVCYDPLTDVSIVVMLPLWDLSRGNASFINCIKAMSEAGWAAREVLGYPGKP